MALELGLYSENKKDVRRIVAWKQQQVKKDSKEADPSQDENNSGVNMSILGTIKWTPDQLEILQRRYDNKNLIPSQVAHELGLDPKNKKDIKRIEKWKSRHAKKLSKEAKQDEKDDPIEGSSKN